MSCQFANLCRFYQDGAKVCCDDDNAAEYCGAYTTFEHLMNFKAKNRSPVMMK
jgi:hypothetical protein